MIVSSDLDHLKFWMMKVLMCKSGIKLLFVFVIH